MTNINVNENLNVYGAITQKNNEKEEDRAVVALNSNFSNNNTSFTFSFNILDIEAVESNKDEIQKQIDDFLLNVRNKMKELGYLITV